MIQFDGNKGFMMSGTTPTCCAELECLLTLFRTVLHAKYETQEAESTYAMILLEADKGFRENDSVFNNLFDEEAKKILSEVMGGIK